MELVELEEPVLVGLEYLFPLPLYSYAISPQRLRSLSFSEIVLYFGCSGAFGSIGETEKPVLLVLVESVLNFFTSGLTGATGETGLNGVGNVGFTSFNFGSTGAIGETGAGGMTNEPGFWKTPTFELIKPINRWLTSRISSISRKD